MSEPAVCVLFHPSLHSWTLVSVLFLAPEGFFTLLCGSGGVDTENTLLGSQERE